MKNLLTLSFVIFAVLSATAQDKFFYINLDVNKPLSNTEWLDNTATRGLRAGYRSSIQESNFSAGLDVSWTTYNQYIPRATYESGNRTITTDFYHYIYSYSAAVSGQYNFRKEGMLIPYAGIGLGANYNQYVQYYNVYEDTDAGWGFLARPEAGLLIKFGEYRRLGAMVGVHYDFSTNKSDMFRYNNFSSVGFQLGLIFLD